MKRDQFTVAVRTPDGRPPTLDIVYDGPDDELDDRLSADGERITAADLDAALRLRGAPAAEEGNSNDGDSAADDPEGVFSLTHRLTGEYLLEVNAHVESVEELVAAAREVDDNASYRIRIRPEGEDATVYKMSALFVYDSEGELLRQRSLIPSGVEL